MRGRWAVLVNITHSEILSNWLHLFTCVQVILIGLPMSFNCNKGLSQHLKHNRRFITNLQINCLIYQIHTTFWVQHTNNTASNADHTTTTIKQISKDKQHFEKHSQKRVWRLQGQGHRLGAGSFWWCPGRCQLWGIHPNSVPLVCHWVVININV